MRLLGYDDTCRYLYFERLFQYEGNGKQIALHMNMTRVWSQIEEAFATMASLHMVPSHEFYYGFCCNMWLGREGNVTFYDFESYKRSKNAAVLGAEIKEELRTRLQKLLKLPIHATPPRVPSGTSNETTPVPHRLPSPYTNLEKLRQIESAHRAREQNRHHPHQTVAMMMGIPPQDLDDDRR